MQDYLMYIGGKKIGSHSKEWIESYDPYLGKPWSRIPKGNQEDANAAVEAAYAAFKETWRNMPPTKRGKILYRFGELIQKHAEDLAEIEVRDNGKLYSEMLLQVKNVPEWYFYFGGLADKIEGEVLPTTKPDLFNYTQYEPYGVCVAITAWNSPLMLAAWKLAPALAAGNTVILKPSEHASCSSLALADLIEEAGFPKGVVNVVSGYGPEIGEALIQHPKIAKIGFTGSEKGGKHIYETASKDLKKVTLELGGKSPNIVFPDTRMEDAVKGVISGIFAATGQTCIAGSRAIVHKSIYKPFVEELVAFAKKATIGNPMEADTQVGPIATYDQYQKVLSYITIAKEEGARCELGGKRAETKQGWFIEPTIFSDVHNKMRIAREEVFGPVLVVIPFEEDEEAVEIANDSPYGLAAGLWTKDAKRIFRIANQLEAGTVWVNTYRALNYLSPFGGYKHSGIGRESGQKAIYEYLQTKSIWISTADEVPNPFVMQL